MQTPQVPEPSHGQPRPVPPGSDQQARSDQQEWRRFAEHPARVDGSVPPPGWAGRYPAGGQQPYSPVPGGQPHNQVWSPAQQYGTPPYRPAAQPYQHGAPQYRADAQPYQPGAPQYRADAQPYQPGAPQFPPAQQQYPPGRPFPQGYSPYGEGHPPDTRGSFPPGQDQPTRQRPEQAPDAAGPSRRNLLIGTGVAVVAGAAGYTAFVRYGPSPASNESSASGATTAPNALAKVADIPVNGGIVLAAEKIVLTRGTGDQVKAFTAVCTHQGCLVTKVSNATIQCPCHGSRFDASTGAVVNGPAKSPLAQVPIKVVNGVVEEK